MLFFSDTATCSFLCSGCFPRRMYPFWASLIERLRWVSVRIAGACSIFPLTTAGTKAHPAGLLPLPFPSLAFFLITRYTLATHAPTPMNAHAQTLFL